MSGNCWRILAPFYDEIMAFGLASNSFIYGREQNFVVVTGP
jgi:hypothetical protein